jgi:hypothetical protein
MSSNQKTRLCELLFYHVDVIIYLLGKPSNSPIVASGSAIFVFIASISIFNPAEQKWLFHRSFKYSKISLQSPEYRAANQQIPLILSHLISSLASFAAGDTQCLENDCQRKSSRCYSSHSICRLGASKYASSGTFLLNSFSLVFPHPSSLQCL